MSDNNEYVLFAKSIQSSQIKQLIDALNSLLVDICLEWNSEGMKVAAIDDSHTVLLHIKLPSKNWEEYYVDNTDSPIKVGLSVLRLYHILKTVQNSNVLTFYVKKKEPDVFHIRVDNPDKKITSNFRLNMLDIDYLKPKPWTSNMDISVCMPSHDFQKIVRDMSQLSTNVEIRATRNELVFSCSDQIQSCSQQTIFSTDIEDESNVQIRVKDDGDNPVYRGIFSLKYLSTFNKCSQISSQVTIHLKIGHSLVLCYESSLGELKIALTPQIEDL